MKHDSSTIEARKTIRYKGADIPVYEASEVSAFDYGEFIAIDGDHFFIMPPGVDPDFKEWYKAAIKGFIVWRSSEDPEEAAAALDLYALAVYILEDQPEAREKVLAALSCYGPEAIQEADRAIMAAYEAKKEVITDLIKTAETRTPDAVLLADLLRDPAPAAYKWQALEILEIRRNQAIISGSGLKEPRGRKSKGLTKLPNGRPCIGFIRTYKAEELEILEKIKRARECKTWTADPAQHLKANLKMCCIDIIA